MIPPSLFYSISCSIAYILSGYILIVEGVIFGNLPPYILGDNRDKCFRNSLCANIFPTDNYLHLCFWHDTLSLFVRCLILAHIQIFLSRQGRGASENVPTCQSDTINPRCSILPAML